MNVALLTSTESIHDMENFAAIAYLTCHDNTDKEYRPQEKLECAIKERHESILEHINLTFSINGLSRACLQELARHRHISLSVESTRHTLKKKLENEEEIEKTIKTIYEILPADMFFKLADFIPNYILAVLELENHPLKCELFTTMIGLLFYISQSRKGTRYEIKDGKRGKEIGGIIQNDELKYFLPEFWPTNLIITLNIREFRHILKLRTAPQALKEFRILARSMFNEVPEQFKYLLQDCVHEEVKHE